MRTFTVDGELVDDETTALFKAISDWTNRSQTAKNTKQLAYLLANNEHRTLQQSFGKVIQALLVEHAQNYSAGRYDLRNEALTGWAWDVVDVHVDGPTPLPFI